MHTVAGAAGVVESLVPQVAEKGSGATLGGGTASPQPRQLRRHCAQRLGGAELGAAAPGGACAAAAQVTARRQRKVAGGGEGSSTEPGPDTAGISS